MTRSFQIIAKLRHNTVNTNALDKYVEQEVTGNDVTVKVTMPDESDNGEYALQLYEGKEAPNNNVLNYLLTEKKKDFQKKKEKKRKKSHSEAHDEDEIRGNLTNALTRYKLEELQKAIADFENAKLEDTNGDLEKAKRRVEQLLRDKKQKRATRRMRVKLRRAMKRRRLSALDEAITEAEEADFKDKKLLAEAHGLLHELQQEEEDRKAIEQYREKMVAATDKRDLEDLEEAIRQFEQAGLEDNGDLTRARQVLYELYEQAAEDAVAKAKKTGNVDDLEKVMEACNNSVVTEDLFDSNVILEAERYLRQQRRLSHYMSPVLALKLGTVAEIRSYSLPKKVTKDVMKATFITLGEKGPNLKNWNQIQNLLNPSQMIVRRIKTFDMGSFHNNRAKRSNSLLQKYTMDDVREVSAGVATFYKWSYNMLELKKSEDGEGKAERR